MRTLVISLLMLVSAHAGPLFFKQPAPGSPIHQGLLRAQRFIEKNSDLRLKAWPRVRVLDEEGIHAACVIRSSMACTLHDTIYLPRGLDYNGRDMYFLVHELTHVMQNQAGFDPYCRKKREERPYRLQRKWMLSSGYRYKPGEVPDELWIQMATVCFPVE